MRLAHRSTAPLLLAATLLACTQAQGSLKVLELDPDAPPSRPSILGGDSPGGHLGTCVISAGIDLNYDGVNDAFAGHPLSNRSGMGIIAPWAAVEIEVAELV